MSLNDSIFVLRRIHHKIFYIFQACDTKSSRHKFKQTVQRTATQLAEAHRIKRRKLGAGAKSLISSDEENMIAKCIEDKATYHGRRHNTVMYTNRYC